MQFCKANCQAIFKLFVSVYYC